MGHHSAPVISPETMFLPTLDERGVPSVLPGTVGLVATSHVALGDLEVANAEYSAAFGDTILAEEWQIRANRTYSEARRTIGEVRGRIALTAHDPLTAEYLQLFMGGQFAQSSRRTLKHASIIDWASDAKDGATDEQMYTFLTEHVAKIKKEQEDPKLQTEIAAAKATYIAGVHHGVRIGALPTIAIDTLNEVINTQVLLGDRWDEVVMSGARAYYLPGQKYVVCAQGVTPEGTLQNIRHLPHELEHVQFTGISGMGLPRWMLEARAENVAMSIEQGDWNRINPSQRVNDSGIYVPERMLLATLGSEGKERIDPYLITKALASPYGSIEWRHFGNALMIAWGAGILQKVNQRVNQYERVLQSQKRRSLRYCQEKALDAVTAELRVGDLAIRSRAPAY